MRKKTISDEFAKSLKFHRQLLRVLIMGLVVLVIAFVTVNILFPPTQVAKVEKVHTNKTDNDIKQHEIMVTQLPKQNGQKYFVNTAINVLCVLVIILLVAMIWHQMYRLHVERNKITEMRSEERDKVINYFYEKKKKEICDLERVLEELKKVVKESEGKKIENEFDNLVSDLKDVFKNEHTLGKIEGEISKLMETNDKEKLEFTRLVERVRDTKKKFSELMCDYSEKAGKVKEELNKKIHRTNAARASVKVLIEKCEEQNSLQHMLHELEEV
ncbi:MAG: hypothetical protein ACEPOZ_10520 [Marinifilaceae bacterium]